MSIAAIGFFIIAFCVRLTIGETTVLPLLPACIGYFFVQKGMKAVRFENDLLKLAYKIAKIAMFATVPILVLDLVGVESWAYALYQVLKFAEILTSIAIGYIVIEGIHQMEDKYGYVMGSYELRTMWNIIVGIYAVTEAAAFITQFPVWLTAILLVVKLMFLIMFMQKYIEASQLYDRRDAQGKMSKEEDGPRFRL
ncbi:MAG: hypothetical protein IKS10_08795 [Lachnospiraceae bacterium]|nr:hypothetical protein [Lachnospiraceae bacterium]